VQTLFLQLGLGYSILRAGLTMIPFSIAVSFFAGFSASKLVGIFGRKVLQIGPLLMALGLVALIFVVRANGGETTSWHLAAGLSLGGAGMGMVVAPIGIFVLSEVPVSQAGPASGLYNTVQQLAGAIGIATLGTVFFSRLDTLLKGSQKIPQDAFVQSYEVTLWVMVAILIVSAASAGFLPKQPTYDDTAMAH